MTWCSLFKDQSGPLRAGLLVNWNEPGGLASSCSFCSLCSKFLFPSSAIKSLWDRIGNRVPWILMRLCMISPKVLHEAQAYWRVHAPPTHRSRCMST